jgi:TPR repeat protein
MTKVAESKAAKTLCHYAQYNVGRAYFQGFGVKQSDEETEKWWLLAADDGNKNASITAMTMLAFFYSRKSSNEFFNLQKAYFWHNEACGNGSLESQGALGAMFYYGVGTKRNLNAAYECLTEASERGNVYALGLLCDYYYQNKFYIKAADLSEKVASLFDIDNIAKETNCLKEFIVKGISLASFIYARCLHLGKGVKQNDELAKQYYKRVSHLNQIMFLLFIYLFFFLCV